MKVYLVGGAVRDSLLGLAVKDKDWVVVGETEASMKQQGFSQVGSDFPVFLHPESKQEYALARTERKNGKGYTGFTVNSSQNIALEEDLLRRDLTINAMAMDANQQIIDPFNGQQDLQKRVLRHVSDAFQEDPLRVLRVARFAARYHSLGFSVANETMALMKQMVDNGELQHLVSERVWKETSRALMEEHPEVYFEILRECGALDVWFPELACLWGIPNPAQWHPEIDTGVHTMMVVQQASLLSDSLTIRYAALVHDLGKALTDPDQWPSHRGHETLGLTPIAELSDKLKVPNDCKELALLMSEFHSHIHRAFDLKPSTILKVLNRCDAWRKTSRFEQLLITCKADARGRTGFEHIDYEQANFLRNAFEAAAAIDVKPIVEKGFTGKAIREQLDIQRIDAIRTVKKQWETQTAS